jgi:hypothetical protein
MGWSSLYQVPKQPTGQLWMRESFLAEESNKGQGSGASCRDWKPLVPKTAVPRTGMAFLREPEIPPHSLPENSLHFWGTHNHVLSPMIPIPRTLASQSCP